MRRLYELVEKVGYVQTVEREQKIVGVMSGVGRVIFTLVVDPAWQRRGVGRAGGGGNISDHLCVIGNGWNQHYLQLGVVILVVGVQCLGLWQRATIYKQRPQQLHNLC